MSDDENQFHHRVAETRRKQKSKAKTELTEVAEDTEGWDVAGLGSRNRNNARQGGTETRRNEVKGKPEFTEAAEATEDRRGAEEIYRRLNFFIL